ncbi:MAG: hypothetical protein H6733_07025 [Alphaproteobacteria bacterium]|nr:hypothetical protein [Alphaproteobacteria bacterium]
MAHVRSCLVALLVLGCTGTEETPVDEGPATLQVTATVAPMDAWATDGTRTVVSRGETLVELPDTTLDRDGLPDGATPFLAVHGDDTWAWVQGTGLFRRGSSGAWTRADVGLSSAILGLLNPDARPVPEALAVADDGTVWLACAGGLFRGDGSTWTQAPTATSGGTNILFTDVAVDGLHLAASAILPESIIPSAYAGLLKGVVFVSDDGGASWREIGADLPSRFVSAVAVDGTTVHVGTLDRGVWTWSGGTWTAVDGSPSDVVSLDRVDGALVVGSASRGAWQQVDGAWHAVGEGPVRGGHGGHLALVDGTLVDLVAGGSVVPAPASAGGQVHLALSFHGNYYHSYRGDTADEDGFGKDIRVITTSLDWLDAHPDVHAEWDIDNAFSTDDWMPAYSPGILARIRARVADGRDDVRLMSWNNGAMASMTRAEFDAAIGRAKTSNAAAFGAWVPGVQPQENMFSPAHLGWYRDLGIDWITLFYSANGFTSNRLDVTLSGADATNPVTLEAPDGSASMTWVPVYHHADVLEHGGLRGWAQQLHDAYAEDTLLVVHFDADGESWENFGAELDAVEGLPFLHYVNIQDYLDDHAPVTTVTARGDQADGTGDGFQSWAEKDWNHRLFTEVIAARRAEDLARFLGVDDAHPSAEAALTERLLALSTTNYGLAMPVLHPDRVASGAAQAQAARDAADAMLADALGDPPAVDVLRVVQPRDASGPARLEASLLVDAFDAERGRIVVTDPDGVDHDAEVLDVVDGAPSRVRVAWVAQVAGRSDTTWHWRWDTDDVAGAATVPVPALDALQAPFLDCDGERTTLAPAGTPVDAPGAVSHGLVRTWEGTVCGGLTTVTHTLRRWDGLPGVEVDVVADVADVGLDGGLQSVVLSPLLCPVEASAVAWPTMAGEVQTRPMRAPVASWNGQAADGWAAVTCDGVALSVAHDTSVRTSMAFLPLQTQGGHTLLAPLGTLWGPGPWHDGRRTGGQGMGDLVVPVVGSQFAPAAPDWAGQHVHYRLLVGDDLDADVLDLYAYPPRVVVRAAAR